jgi:uncharacterized protein YejL (UPF0352 family)
VGVSSYIINVLNKNKMPKQLSSIVSHHDLDKSIIATCIAKYENEYILYLILAYTFVKTITSSLVKINLNYISAKGKNL